MNRDTFVRMATSALRRNAGLPAEAQAEAIAVAMDIVAEAMGEAPPPVAAAPLARTAFPSPNPQAVAPVGQSQYYEPEPEADLPQEEALPPVPVYAGPPLITTDTRMPPREQRAAAAPVRSLRPPPPATRMTVAELSMLVQERTPKTLVFDVPMEDESTRRMVFERNVIPMSSADSVQLVYGPRNALPSAREAVEVQAVLHIEDTLDLVATVAKLKAEATESVRPKKVREAAMPAVNLGPVKHSSDGYQDPAGLTAQTLGAFGTIT